MIIQSKRVWIAGQFMPAQVKIEDKKIIDIYPYGTNAVDPYTWLPYMGYK